jgi:hypothetical protein
MRIQVDCAGTPDPHSLFLGARRLHVMRVLERGATNADRKFRVRVADGRELVLLHDTRSGEWQLIRVAPRPIR